MVHIRINRSLYPQRKPPLASSRNVWATLSRTPSLSIPFCDAKENVVRAGMSAPIDDLLYGGDDSGDEEEINSVLASIFSFPLCFLLGY